MHFRAPSSQPSGQPTVQPSSEPTCEPSSQPSSIPSAQPSMTPSLFPSGQPSSIPSCQPTTQPTSIPSNQPTSTPTSQPTVLNLIAANPFTVGVDSKLVAAKSRYYLGTFVCYFFVFFILLIIMDKMAVYRSVVDQLYDNAHDSGIRYHTTGSCFHSLTYSQASTKQSGRP